MQTSVTLSHLIELRGFARDVFLVAKCTVKRKISRQKAVIVFLIYFSQKKAPQVMQKYQGKVEDQESKENKPTRPVSADERHRQPAVKVAGRPVSANDANRAPPARPANLAWNAAKQGEVDR